MQALCLLCGGATQPHLWLCAAYRALDLGSWLWDAVWRDTSPRRWSQRHGPGWAVLLTAYSCRALCTVQHGYVRLKGGTVLFHPRSKEAPHQCLRDSERPRCGVDLAKISRRSWCNRFVAGGAVSLCRELIVKIVSHGWRFDRRDCSSCRPIMVLISVLNDALRAIYNAEKRGKRQVGLSSHCAGGTLLSWFCPGWSFNGKDVRL